MSRVLGMFEVKTLIYEAQERPVVFVAFGLQRVVFFTVGAVQDMCFSPHVSCEKTCLHKSPYNTLMISHGCLSK